MHLLRYWLLVCLVLMVLGRPRLLLMAVIGTLLLILYYLRVLGQRCRILLLELALLIGLLLGEEVVLNQLEKQPKVGLLHRCRLHELLSVDSALLLGSTALAMMVMMLRRCCRLVLVIKHELVVFLLE